MNIMGPCLLVFIAVLMIAPTELEAAESESESGWDKIRWQQELLEARAAREEQMASSRTSILATVAHVWHTSQETLFFDFAPAGFSYSETEGQHSKVVMELSGEHWEWRPLDTTVSVTFRGRPMGEGRLQPGMIFDILGRYTFVIWSGLEGNLQFAVFDDQSLTQKTFTGLVHYAPDDHYRLEAEFEPFKDPKTVKMLTNISGTRDFFRYGEVRFAIDGQPQRLTAYKELLDEKRLFIPFRDETAGKTTYGAGRFLNASEPESGPVIIDFNRAVNIPCSYAPWFHCPLPPLENWLKVAVTAGEQIYPLPK